MSFPKSSNLQAVCKQFTNSRCTDRSNKGCSHHSNTSPNQRLQKKSRNPSQLSLLSQQTDPTIGTTIEPVPQHLALAPNRFYIWLTIDFERWAIPIQLTRSEVLRLLPLLAEVRDRSQALDIVERVLPPTMEGAS